MSLILTIEKDTHMRAAGRNQPDHDTAPPAQRRGMTRGLTFLFAVAGGAAVGNLYWAQPLLDFIARDLHASTVSAGWLVTATQIGYAAGILLIVPLGDVLNRRWLIPVMMVCSAAALVGCALAPSFGVLLLTITVLGVTTVSGQILTPLAGDLADDAHRGRVVGTVVSGILTGILVSRAISGLVAGAAGWRAIYAAAAADVLLAIVLYRAIPPLPPKAHLSYPALIASVGRVVLRERTIRWTLVLGATAFGLFTMFWTSLTFLLSARAVSTTEAGRCRRPARGGSWPSPLSRSRGSRATPSRGYSSRSSSSTSPSRA